MRETFVARVIVRPIRGRGSRKRRDRVRWRHPVGSGSYPASAMDVDEEVQDGSSGRSMTPARSRPHRRDLYERPRSLRAPTQGSCRPRPLRGSLPLNDGAPRGATMNSWNASAFGAWAPPLITLKWGTGRRGFKTCRRREPSEQRHAFRHRHRPSRGPSTLRRWRLRRAGPWWACHRVR